MQARNPHRRSSGRDAGRRPPASETDMPSVDWATLEADPLALRRGTLAGARVAGADPARNDRAAEMSGKASERMHIATEQRHPFFDGKAGGLTLRWSFLVFSVSAWALLAWLLLD